MLIFLIVILILLAVIWAAITFATICMYFDESLDKSPMCNFDRIFPGAYIARWLDKTVIAWLDKEVE